MAQLDVSSLCKYNQFGLAVLTLIKIESNSFMFVLLKEVTSNIVVVLGDKIRTNCAGQMVASLVFHAALRGVALCRIYGCLGALQK